MANPYRSREGLSTRAVANSDEFQLRIDPVHADLDEAIWGLHRQVSQLKHVAQEIETEARIQSDIVSDLMEFTHESSTSTHSPQRLMNNAQAGVKHGMRRLNKTINQQRSNHVLQVIAFGLMCFLVVYMWSKHFRR